MSGDSPIGSTAIEARLARLRAGVQSHRPFRDSVRSPDVCLDVMEIAPQHVVEAMKATLYFGFRRGEIFNATVDQVDLQNGGFRLEAEDSKNNEDAFMPGAPEAMAFLAELVEQAKSRGVRHLITWRRYHKDPERQARGPWVSIKQPKRAWKTAMDAIEAKHGRRYRWHDLRAAFITHVAMTSGSLAAQRLARHSDFSTTQDYIEAADSIRRDAANQAANRPALQQSCKQNLQTELDALPTKQRKSLK